METKIRLFTYKSFRHYGGRVITPTPHICNAIFIKDQTDGSKLFELLQDCAGFKKGHLIAVWSKNYNV